MKSGQVEAYYARVKKQTYHGPLITTIDGHKIAQRHHPKPVIDKIYGGNRIKQFTSIQVIGTPGTGKTTLVTFLAHEIHTRDPSYQVFHFGKEELLRLDETLESLPNCNIIVIFDDVTAVFKLIKDQDQKTRIIETLTEARHPKLMKTDRKVIFIVNTHYENSMEKIWRSQSGWKIYTDLNNEERENLNARTKGIYKKRLKLFADIIDEELSNINEKTDQPEYTIPIQGNLKYVYSPWDLRFVMAYDGSKLRFMLVPPHSCNLCSQNKKNLRKTNATEDEIITLMMKYYGPAGVAGLKLALNQAGETVQFPNKTVYGLNTALELLGSFNVDKKKLAQRLRERAQIRGTGLHTIRKKKTDFFADLEKIRNGPVEPISKGFEDVDLEDDEILEAEEQAEFETKENTISEQSEENEDAEQQEAKTFDEES